MQAQENINSDDVSLIEQGLLWASDCREKYGFVHTLGLIEFLSSNIKQEMTNDIAQHLADWGSKQ